MYFPQPCIYFRTKPSFNLLVNSWCQSMGYRISSLILKPWTDSKVFLRYVVFVSRIRDMQNVRTYVQAEAMVETNRSDISICGSRLIMWQDGLCGPHCGLLIRQVTVQVSVLSDIVTQISIFREQGMLAFKLYCNCNYGENSHWGNRWGAEEELKMFIGQE